MNEPAPTPQQPVDRADLDAVERQLGRPPRGVVGVAHRCPCGEPDVLRTQPRLPDGTPFPTTYYATCPRLTGAVSTLETAGVMKEMTERLARDEQLAEAYARAHEHYLAQRAELGEVPEIEGTSAGGMPTRVKCLHVLVGHSLAAGPGVNPLGDEALAMLDDWWQPTSCAALHAAEDLAQEAPVADPAPEGTIRVGAIDCGTNSIRLLVADVDPGSGALTDVRRRMEIVRLGHGVDRTGVIAPESMERTLAVTREYAAACRELDAVRVRFVATSASRDASNAADFIEGVRAAFVEHYGSEVVPEVVSGDEEAALSFAGATGGLAAQGVSGPYLVVDLGGGSTELVRGTDHVEAARSVDIGCVRMTERHLVSDPPTDEEVAAATRDIDTALDLAESVVPIAGVATLVGLAGSVTTITAHLLRLTAYDPERIHLARSAPADMVAACDDLLAMSRAQRAELPYMHPGRVDVIGAGALVWRRVVERVVERAGVTQVVTSEHDILDGIALSVARRH